MLRLPSGSLPFVYTSLMLLKNPEWLPGFRLHDNRSENVMGGRGKNAEEGGHSRGGMHVLLGGEWCKVINVSNPKLS